MSLHAFLRRVVAALDDAELPYMIAGSVAGTFYSAPRTTHDVDIVVDVDPASVERLLDRLASEDMYVSADAARDAVRRRSMFNLIDLDTGWKADLIVRKRRRFSAEEFGRRQRVVLGDLPVWMVTAEDCALAKLEWARDGASERQLRDVRALVEAQGEAFDRAYIERWAHELGVEREWTLAQPGGATG